MSVLGSISPSLFLRRHWHKRPLLVRQAVPGFAGLVDRDDFLALATRPEATSRLVMHHPRRRQRWERHDGPFGALEASMLPARDWTLLVHGVESLIPGGWELLRRFDFIPAARVDDLMISYAADGGSVGPHDDLYDVFLLQGPGRRRWQISSGGDRRLDPGAAIKVLAHFRPEEEWVLDPGDMLYLPPGVAHFGVAEGPCFTYSVGFAAPSHGELIHNFLAYLGEFLGAEAQGRYRDPDLRLPRRPLEIGESMTAQVAAVLDGIGWDRATVGDFVGRFLTRPRARVTFAAPARPLDEAAFERRLSRRGRLTLALPSRGLVRRGRLFFNGEAHQVRPSTMRVFERLILDRGLALPARLDASTRVLLHDWYLSGYLTVR
jgi:50S ribosomal protein L16 3-hydroxylase